MAAAALPAPTATTAVKMTTFAVRTWEILVRPCRLGWAMGSSESATCMAVIVPASRANSPDPESLRNGLSTRLTWA